VSTIREAVQKRILSLGIRNHVLGSVREERLVKLGEKRLRPCRIWRVSKLPVNLRDDTASGSLDEHAQDRHDDDERYGTYRPTITS
jgi:hypothetical protein